MGERTHEEPNFKAKPTGDYDSDMPDVSKMSLAEIDKLVEEGNPRLSRAMARIALEVDRGPDVNTDFRPI